MLERAAARPEETRFAGAAAACGWPWRDGAGGSGGSGVPADTASAMLVPQKIGNILNVIKAVEKITKDLDPLLAFYDYPAEH
jgi:hypothetical protein